MLKKVDMLRKKNRVVSHQKQEGFKCIDDLTRMLEKKENQVEEMRAEIERLAEKLCKAHSQIHDNM